MRVLGANMDPNCVARWGAYAHFPGTGPQGKTCASCKFTAIKDKDGNDIKKPKCKKYAELLHRQHHATETIDPNSPACKYWEER